MISRLSTEHLSTLRILGIPAQNPEVKRHRLSARFVTMILILGTAASPLFGKKASDLFRQQVQKAGIERSMPASRNISETPQSLVRAGTLNKILQEEYQHSPGMLEFEQKNGPRWQVTVDERSLAPMSLMGEGVPFTARSTQANKLSPARQMALTKTESLETLEIAARQFLADNQAFLKVDPASLQLDRQASGTVEARTGKYRLFFQNYYHSIPVLGSYVTMFISHGNMILYNAQRMADIRLSTTPSLSPQQAAESLGRALGVGPSELQLFHAAELFITFVEPAAAKTARAKAALSEAAPADLYVGPPGQGYEPVLVYRVEFGLPKDSRSLVALLDAHTGALVDLYDQNRYQNQSGKVLGAIYTRGPVSTAGMVNSGGTQAPEYMVPLDGFRVTNGTVTVTTNPGGLYPFNGQNPSSFSGAFSGTQANIREIGTAVLCPSPQGPADNSGNIFFPAHSDDGRCSVNPGSPAPGNGQATHAARNGWFHANFAIVHAEKFLKGFNPEIDAFFNSNFNVLVNDNGCPAFWSNGCSKAGGQECMDLGACGTDENNQANEPDTMSHEYGHALDYHTKPSHITGDNGKGEGLADIDAWLNTHRTCLSPGDGFPPVPPGSSSAGFPVGDACNTSGLPVEPAALQQTGVRDFGVFICHDNGSGACPPGTTGRLESNDTANACGSPTGSCRGSLRYECHCEGHTTSGSVIDLFKALVQRYGTNQAWYMIERLYYLGLGGITDAYGTAGAASTYSNFLAADDDNGNLADGTPNADLIFQAFRRHGTEGSQVPRLQANCTTSPGSGSPSAPASFTATPQSAAGILLQWSAVPGATGYFLYRSAASQPGHNYESDAVPSSFYGRNGVFFALINPSSRGPNPSSGTNFFTASGSGTQSYLDLEVAPGYEYFYQIQAAVPLGNTMCLSSLSPNQVDLVANAIAPGSQSAGKSQVNLAVQNGGAVTEPTIGSPGSVQVGYGVVTLNTGNAPYGTAVFSYSPNNIVLSEVGVPASPATTQARIFIDFRTGVQTKSGTTDISTINVNTGFAIVNRGSAIAHITYTLREFTGVNPLAVGHGTLPAGAHRARFIDQLQQDLAPDFQLPPNFSTTTKFGSLEITSDQPLSVLALRQTNNQRGDTLFTSTPIVDENQALTSLPLYFPQLVDGGGYKTTLVLLNPSNATMSGQMRFFGDNGSPLIVHQVNGPSASTFQYSIQPNGFFVFQTDGSPGSVNIGSAQLIPDPISKTPVGAGLFNLSQNGVLVTESGIPSATPTTHARIYIDKSGGHDTGLAVANPGTGQLNVVLTAYRTDGVTPAGSSSGNISLAGNGHSAKFVGEFISGLPVGFTGILDISSSQPFGTPPPFVALTLRSLNNARTDFLLTTFPIADANAAAPTPLIFPQIADGGGYITQIILLGPNGAATTTLNFFGDDGTPLLVAQ